RLHYGGSRGRLNKARTSLRLFDLRRSGNLVREITLCDKRCAVLQRRNTQRPAGKRVAAKPLSATASHSSDHSQPVQAARIAPVRKTVRNLAIAAAFKVSGPIRS